MAAIEGVAVTGGDVAVTKESPPPMVGTSIDITAALRATHTTSLLCHTRPVLARRTRAANVEWLLALDGLDVGFEGALHTHHPLLKEGTTFNGGFRPKTS